MVTGEFSGFLSTRRVWVTLTEARPNVLGSPTDGFPDLSRIGPVSMP